jgi:uncharacterized protein YihD (DUF1040 family)
MANEVQGELKLYVLQETDLNLTDFLIKFSKENIIDAKLQIVLSDGSVHTLHVCDILERMMINSFLIDGKDVIQTEIKATKQETSVAKVAI